MTTTSKKMEILCEGKPTVIIPQHIWSDLFYIHNKFKGIEWSGYAYYDKVGELNNPNTVIITLRKFILLDIGTVGATDIQPSPEQVVNMFEKNPDIMGKHQALIHTH